MAVLHCHCMGYYSDPFCHHEGESAVSPYPANLRTYAKYALLSTDAATTLLYERQEFVLTPNC